MLSFFRKHQRFFFIVVTSVVVVSFCFFGTLGSQSRVQELPDRAVVKAVDGSEIMQRDLATLCRMIGSSPLDRHGMERGIPPNLLNDSVIEKELIASGMAMLLARHYFEELRPDLETRLARIKSYRPYAHAQYPHIGAEAIWRQFLPSLTEHLNVLRMKSDQLTFETLSILFQLYLDQAMLPADFLKQILTNQLAQQGLPQDPILAHSDLSLFGFHSLEDWFGPRFVELAGQFIMNAARFADQHGYQVSNEAVRTELYQNIVNGYREVSRQDKVEGEAVVAYYQRKMHEWGIDERQMLSSWRQVMLFRRLFQDVGNSVFLDPLPFEQFHRYTKQAVKADLYELPSHLRLRDLFDVFKLQVYLEAVSSEHARHKNLLSLPQQLASLDEIEKRSPELVERTIEVEYAQVSKEQLAREISLKETWNWEVQDASWNLLNKQFPKLFSSPAQSVSERHRALDKLDAKERLKVDAYAQQCMIDQQPERIAAALDRSAMRQQKFGLRGAGLLGPFHQINNQQQLIDLLRAAPIRGQEAFAEQKKVEQSLYLYSEDQQTFYRIAVLDRSEERTLLSFAQVQRDGTLDRILDKRLEEAYPDIRRKHAAQFQKTDGTWKPYMEVREKVGRVVFADLLKAIEESNHSLAQALSLNETELPSAFYAQNRLYRFMNQVKGQIEANAEDRQWVREDSEAAASLSDQWKLVKKCQRIERSSDFNFAKEQMFTIPVGGWSPVDIGQSGALAFYRVLHVEEPSDRPVAETVQGHQMLSLDAQRDFFLGLLKQIEEKQAIRLTAFSGDEA